MSVPARQVSFDPLNDSTRAALLNRHQSKGRSGPAPGGRVGQTVI
jgi:hypothetical protein